MWSASIREIRTLPVIEDLRIGIGSCLDALRYGVRTVGRLCATTEWIVEIRGQYVREGGQ